MQTGSWSAGIFFSFDWAVAVAEEADLTFRAAREVRAIDQECLDVLLKPSDDHPAPVVPLKLREPTGTKMPAPANPDYPELKRRYA